MTLQILKPRDQSKNNGVINDEFTMEEKEVAEILFYLDELIFSSDNKGVISCSSLPSWNCKRKRSACRPPSSELQPAQKQQQCQSVEAVHPSTMEVEKSPSPIPLTSEAQTLTSKRQTSPSELTSSHLQPTQKKLKLGPIEAVQPSIVENSLPCTSEAQPWTCTNQGCPRGLPPSQLQPIQKQQKSVPIEDVSPSMAEHKVLQNSTPSVPAAIQVPEADPISGEDSCSSILEMEWLLLHRVPKNKIFKSNEKMYQKWFSKYQHNAVIQDEIIKLRAYYHNLKAVNFIYKSIGKKLMKDDYLESAKVLDFEKDEFKKKSDHQRLAVR